MRKRERRKCDSKDQRSNFVCMYSYEVNDSIDLPSSTSLYNRALEPLEAPQPKHTHLLASSSLPNLQCRRAMSNGNGSSGGGARGARLQLHLSPPAARRMEVDGGDGSDSSSSSPSSCVSSNGSPGSKSPMVIGACTRCMMYCMVAKKDFPTYINCKQPSLVDLLHGGSAGGSGGGGGGVAGDDKRRGKGK